jgi:hypothetical protein
VSRRSLGAAAAVLALLGACSDDDDGGAGTDALEDVAEGVCVHLDTAALTGATGVTFDDVEASGTTCTYSAAESPVVLGFSYTDLDDVPPADALALIQESCDAGTVHELDLAVAEAAFGCRVQGELSVAAAGGGHLAVVAGLTLDPGTSDATRYDALGRVLDGTLAEPASSSSRAGET